MRRFLAAFYPAAEFLETTRTAEIAAHLFRVVGRLLVSPGWLVVYGGEVAGGNEDKAKDKTRDKTGDKEVQRLPVMRPGEPVSNDAVTLRQGRTTPPPRYTEASLLAAMENGRPADGRRRTRRSHEGARAGHTGHAGQHH